MTAIYEAEKLSTSSANEHGQGTRVKITGVDIPEFAVSIISVLVLAERAKQSSLGQEVKESSLGREGQAIKSWQRGSSNQFVD